MTSGWMQICWIVRTAPCVQALGSFVHTCEDLPISAYSTHW